MDSYLLREEHANMGHKSDSSILDGEEKLRPKNTLQMLAHEKLYTKDRLAKWGIVSNMDCPLCESEDESREHLFFLCKYSESVWSRLLKWQGIRRKPIEWSMEQEWAKRYARGKNGSADIYRMTLAACGYAIWQERNLRIFQNKKRDAE
uniref:Uncharacterized protein LOC104241523 n=1 Tax=Nicotiana sylvestris TaxID=4096 RepID=A0A1U7Y7H2_NICSY|nr:PREDICTED: uncharacterized protein LOC104241523 [Nicotiana sylvestris]